MAVIKERSSDKLFNIINLVLMTILTLVILYPLVYIISASLSNPDMVNTGKMWLFPVDITLEGYYRVFQDSEIIKATQHHLLY